MSAPTTPKTTYRAMDLLKLSLPLVLTLLLEQLIGLTDVMFLGRYGAVELAASGIASLVFLLLAMIGNAYGFGLQAFISQVNGQKAYSRVTDAFQNGMGFLLGLSLLVMALALAGTPAFMGWACHNGDIEAAGSAYLFWRVLSLPFLYLAAGFRAFFIGTLKPKILTLNAVVLVTTNVLLNYALIFGVGPIPSLGIVGAAIASALAEVVGLLVFVLYALKRVDAGRFALFGRFKPNPGLQFTLFRLARWLILQESVAFFTWLLFFIEIEHLGTTDLGIANIVRNLGSFLFLFLHALGATSGSVAANKIGQGCLTQVSAIGLKGLWVSAGILFPIMAVMAIYPRATLGLFSNIDTIITAAVPTYYVMLGTMVAGFPAMYGTFFVSAIGDTRASGVGLIVGSLLYVVTFETLLQFTQSLPIIWCSDFVFNGVCGLVVLYYYLRGDWRRQKLH